MITKLLDRCFSFETYFDNETGGYYRSNVLSEDGSDTGKDAFMAEFPHHLDIGIMGYCSHGLSGLCKAAGIGCYQSGGILKKEHMPLADFETIAKECRGKTFQFALGGRGDPDCHPEFEAILKCSRDNKIIPNYTTSGFEMTPEKAKISAIYCGAVAVSYYRNSYTYNAIDMLKSAGLTVNLHYVLDKNSIDEAILLLQGGLKLRGISAVIFLLHKPVGQGSRQLMLSYDDERTKTFFSLFQQNNTELQIGFDSCSTPFVLSFAENVPKESYDACEGARFSAYIGSDGIMSPCSFDTQNKWGVSLKEKSIKEVWNSKQFEEYRTILKSACPHCDKRESCLGGCPVSPEINVCLNKNGGVKL